MIKEFAGLLLAGALVGCASSSPPPEDAPRPPMLAEPASDACGAFHVQQYAGQEYSGTVEQRIALESDAQRTRVIRPGQGYTMDYRRDRLNIHLDEDGRISELSCG